VGALAVMAFHNEFFGSFFPHGYLAVDLFFVLSGFVLAETYGERLATNLGATGFMLIRGIRLYPLYAFATVLGVGVQLTYMHLGPRDPLWTLGSFAGTALLSIFFLPTPFFGFTRLYPLLVPAWSLAYELLSNFAWASLGKHFRLWGLGLLVIGAEIGMLVLTLGRGVGVIAGSNWGWTLVEMAVCRVTYSFGMVLFISHLSENGKFRVGSTVILIFALAVLAADPPCFKQYFDLAAVIAIFPLLVFWASNNEPLAAWEAKTFAFLGGASYGIYVLHFPIDAFANKMMSIYGRVPGFWFEFSIMAVIVLLADFLDRVMDMPARRWLTRHLARP
jgi:peptidoglycan/LPS O-acetylase OafA/YrhL